MAFLQNECVCGLATETLDIKARPLEILFSLSTLSGFIVAAWLKPCRHLDVTTWSFMPHFCPLFSFFSLPHGRTLWLIRVGTSWSILKTQHCYDFETNWGRKHPFSLALNLMAGARKNVRQKKARKKKTVIGLRAQKRTWLLKSFVYPLLSLLFSIMRRKCCKHFSAGQRTAATATITVTRERPKGQGNSKSRTASQAATGLPADFFLHNKISSSSLVCFYNLNSAF